MKMFTKTAIVFLVFLVSFEIALAAFGQVFGGRIAATKAVQIQTLEGSGYSCPGSTSTIEISPIKGPTAYFALSSVNKTRTTLAIGQKIIGKYSGEMTIECIHPDGSVVNVILPNVTIFGTSRR